MGGGSWLASASDKYGGSIAAEAPKATTDATAVTTVAPVVQPSMAGMLSPADPMFWFGVVALGTVALMAYSTVQTS